MQITSPPYSFLLQFAQSGAKNVIPVASQIPTNPGGASLTDGFPPATMTSIASGGIPPSGLDWNGILNCLSQAAQWSEAGGMYQYNATFAASVSGYPKGAILLNNTGTSYWQNLTEENSTNPDAGGSGWAPFAGGVVNGPMFLDVTPIGNASPTWALTSMHGVSTSTTQRAFMVDLGMTVATSGGTGLLGGNVVLYAGIDCQPGCGSCWAFNPLLTIESGAGANVNQFQVIEVDLNNNDAPSDAAHFINGVNITQAGTYIANAALGILGGTFSGGSQTGPGWLFGIVIGQNNSVEVANIEMEGNAGWGMDFSVFQGANQIRFANNIPVVVRNHAGSTDLQMLISDTADALHIGAGATSIVLPGGAQLLAATAPLTNGAGALTATLTNSPVTGNPTKWAAINDGGTVRHFPLW